MRIFSLFLLLWGQSLTLFAGENVIHCLAEEEAQFHKSKYKYHGFYFLNQELLGNLVLLNNVKFQNITNNAVCSPNEKYPSLRLLEHLMLYQDRIFVGLDSDDVSEFAIQKSLISEFIRELPSLLHDFISHMQQGTPPPNCLENNIPELKEFYEQMKYIREHMTGKQIITDHNQGSRIVSAFFKIDEIKDKCQKEIDEKIRLEKEKNNPKKN